LWRGNRSMSDVRRCTTAGVAVISCRPGPGQAKMATLLKCVFGYSWATELIGSRIVAATSGLLGRRSDFTMYTQRASRPQARQQDPGQSVGLLEAEKTW